MISIGTRIGFQLSGFAVKMFSAIAEILNPANAAMETDLYLLSRQSAR